MSMRHFSRAVTCLAVLALVCQAVTAQSNEPKEIPSMSQVTFGAILNEMANPAHLSQFPEPGSRALQFSSYDRRSTAPYEAEWFANSDGFGNEPIPNFLEVLEAPDAEGNGRFLMADVKGPGVLLRTWTPHPQPLPGEIRIYLDGSTVPFYQGPGDAFFFDRYRMYTGVDAARPDPFVTYDSSYFPIPFAKGFRMEYVGSMNKIHFYHIGIRQYAEGTLVKTFSPEDTAVFADELAKTCAFLQAKDDAPAPGQYTVDAPAGGDCELFRLEGPAMVTRFALRVEAEDVQAALRDVVVRGYFDGSHSPQIEAPLGALFGSSPGVLPYDSIPITVRPDGVMISRFAMPFAKSAVFQLRNHGPKAARVIADATIAPHAWHEGQTMHLHIKWRADHGLTAYPGDAACDIPWLVARGQGQLVGAALMIFNPTPYVTAGGSWWGEGDEKIWVDDDSFPSYFGTGSEDFFNYSWGVNTIWGGPYGGQAFCTGPGSVGFSQNYRWLIADPIPFRKHIDFYMELWPHDITQGLSYARTVYFYAFPGVRDAHVPPSPEMVTRQPYWTTPWAPKAMEPPTLTSCFHQAENCLAAGQSNVAIEEDLKWAGGKLVRWTPAKVGDALAFEVDVKEAGNYDIQAVFAHTPDSGGINVSVDDKPLPATASPKTDFHVLSRPCGFGAIQLSAGKHTIRLISVDTGSIGLDFLWLTLVKG